MRAHRPAVASLADLTLPAVPEPDAVLSLPGDADPWGVYRDAVGRAQAAFVTHAAKKEWRRWALARTSPTALTDLFWWFCADGVRPDAPHAAAFKASSPCVLSTQIDPPICLALILSPLPSPFRPRCSRESPRTTP